MMTDARSAMLYDAHKKSAVVAYLLWWFLGVFGGHRFYMGRTGTAAAMLTITLVSIPLTVVLVGILGFVVVGVWWLVDAALIPGMVRESNVALIGRLT